MSVGSDTSPKRPTYADIEALPPHLMGQILDGRLVVSPRPALPHSHASSVLGALLNTRFQLGIGGPGGWWILDEVELSLGVDPDYDPVVPDIAGWRIDTLPTPGPLSQCPVVPDWVCEVLSPSTTYHDRTLKLPFYARAGVRHVWLVDPLAHTVEVYRHAPDHTWLLIASVGGNQTLALEPFEAVPLAIGRLWLTAPLRP